LPTAEQAEDRVSSGLERGDGKGLAMRGSGGRGERDMFQAQAVERAGGKGRGHVKRGV
jgi:hypothetical protein